MSIPIEGYEEADFESLIASGHYFTAMDGHVGVTDERHSFGPLAKLNELIFCVLLMNDGTKLVGYADCSDPEEARRLAYSRAREQLDGSEVSEVANAKV